MHPRNIPYDIHSIVDVDNIWIPPATCPGVVDCEKVHGGVRQILVEIDNDKIWDFKVNSSNAKMLRFWRHVSFVC